MALCSWTTMLLTSRYGVSVDNTPSSPKIRKKELLVIRFNKQVHDLGGSLKLRPEALSTRTLLFIKTWPLVRTQTAFYVTLLEMDLLENSGKDL